MTPIVAILTLALASAPAAAPVSAIELLPLPVAPAALALEVLPLERAVVLEWATPQHASAALVKTLRATSRLLCPDVAERDGAVVLTCRSTRVVARLVPRGPAAALELKELPGLPAQGAEAIPLFFHDPLALGLGGCPGTNHAARGECRLREGRVELARGSFLTALRSEVAAERAHAQLRLGDLALGDGDLDTARRHWSAIEVEPWARLARVRRCELSVPCLVEERGPEAYDGRGLPISMARELRLRAARLRAFRGAPLAAAWALADQFSPSGACSGDALLCRRILLAALRTEDGAGEALAIHASALKPGQGPFAAELASAAAAAAERHGAPAYAAALLSSASGEIPPGRLTDHLLRTAELYALAGDGVRARVIHDFVKSHGGAAAVAGARWKAVAARIAALRSRPAAQRGPPPAAPELVAAARALAHARAARTDAEGSP